MDWDRNADIMARRELEKQMIQEGMEVWHCKKQQSDLQKLEEQRELRVMLESYDPWGRPGNGAPMPGQTRKTKLILDQAPPSTEPAPTSVLSMGRPGHGAPLRTKSGRTKTYLKSDPLIRFQFHEPSRKSVENDLRYKSSPQDQENYRRQLDALVNTKKGPEMERRVCKAPTCGKIRQPSWDSKWGKPCPGGQLWRHPGELGHNFLKSLGWSTDATLNKIERYSPHEQEQVFEISGGVELVPLLARNRRVHRCPLSTTDVTRMSKVPNGPSGTHRAPEDIYFRELSNQVQERQQMSQVAQQQDVESSIKHFETWKGFWGRPGNGAPKGENHSKEKLEFILYDLPAKRNPMQGVLH